MILNLFKRKNSWQHKDSNVRIAGINEELNVSNNENKTILLSIVNTDKSELVRRAALIKLNNFDDYYHVSKSNDSKAVQQFAEQQVLDILSGKNLLELTLTQKQPLINRLEIPLLNHWLVYESNPSLVLSLFDALTKKKSGSQVLLQIFSQHINPQNRSEHITAEIQKQLLALDLPELSDESLLTKLNKKAVNQSVNQLILSKLNTIAELKEKPKKLLKHLQLLLAKLLALKEVADYSEYLNKKTALTQEWQQQIVEVSCLPADEQKRVLTKYEKILSQLTQLFVVKAEAFQQEKITQQLQHEKQAAQGRFNQTITTLNHDITNAVFTDEVLVEADFKEKLALISEQLANSILNADEQFTITRQLNSLTLRFTQLPEIAQSVSNATYLISSISQLALPQNLTELNERQQNYQDWLGRWKDVDKKACGMLPASIITAHKEITHTWRNGLKPLQKEQKQFFNQTQKKLNDLKRLLASGKYKVCFGLFKGVNQTLDFLSADQIQQLQRDYDSVNKKMAEISDWEHYIATPRKQALLSEITALVTQPLDNPNDQADKVKQHRKTWNSLGHADEALDHDLNEQFNVACEQAFAPCRMFYAEQEKLRKQHLIVRNDIISQAKQLADANNISNIDAIDFKALDGQLTKLQQCWQQAGEVDRQAYQKLFNQFKSVIQPIKQTIKTFHDANKLSKQVLIKKAEQQLNVDDIHQAIDEIKQLQQQWRSIGFAGNHQESKLWRIFRQVNDQVFAKRDQVKTEYNAVKSSKLATLKLNLNVIKSNVIESNKSSLVNGKNQAEQLLSTVLADKPVLKAAVSAIDTFIKKTNEQVALIEEKNQAESWQALFKLLNELAVIEIDDISNNAHFKRLSSFWQKRLLEHAKLKTSVINQERFEKTLELEILAQQESPTEYASQRMAVKVRLMQAQMLSGTQVEQPQLLVEWLALGQLSAEDVSQIARLEKIFLNKKT